MHSISGFEDNSKKEIKIHTKSIKSNRKISLRSKSKQLTDKQLGKKRLLNQASSDLDYLDWWSKYFLNNQTLKRAKRTKKNGSDSSVEQSSDYQDIRSSHSVEDNGHSSSETKYSRRKKISITKKCIQFLLFCETTFISIILKF